jgi:hypothetical protein
VICVKAVVTGRSVTGARSLIDTLSGHHVTSLTPNIVTNNKLLNQQQAINSQTTILFFGTGIEQYSITNATITLMFPHKHTISWPSQPAQAEQTPSMGSEFTFHT